MATRLVRLQTELDGVEQFVVESDRIVHVQTTLIAALESAGLESQIDQRVLVGYLQTQAEIRARRDEIVSEIARLLADPVLAEQFDGHCS